MGMLFKSGNCVCRAVISARRSGGRTVTKKEATNTSYCHVYRYHKSTKKYRDKTLCPYRPPLLGKRKITSMIETQTCLLAQNRWRSAVLLLPPGPSRDLCLRNRKKASNLLFRSSLPLPPLKHNPTPSIYLPPINENTQT